MPTRKLARLALVATMLLPLSMPQPSSAFTINSRSEHSTWGIQPAPNRPADFLAGTYRVNTGGTLTLTYSGNGYNAAYTQRILFGPDVTYHYQASVHENMLLFYQNGNFHSFYYIVGEGTRLQTRLNNGVVEVLTRTTNTTWNAGNPNNLIPGRP